MGSSENVSSVRKPVGDIVLKATHYIKNQLLSSLLSCQAKYVSRQKALLSALLYWFNLVKSDNLQYDTLARWVDETNNSSTMRRMFQALFLFIISYRLRALKTLYFYICKIFKNIRE